MVLTEERGYRAIAIVPSLRPALAGEDTPAAGAYGGGRGNLLVCENVLRGF